MAYGGGGAKPAEGGVGVSVAAGAVEVTLGQPIHAVDVSIEGFVVMKLESAGIPLRQRIGIDLLRSDHGGFVRLGWEDRVCGGGGLGLLDVSQG